MAPKIKLHLISNTLKKIKLRISEGKSANSEFWYTFFGCELAKQQRPRITRAFIIRIDTSIDCYCFKYNPRINSVSPDYQFGMLNIFNGQNVLHIIKNFSVFLDLKCLMFTIDIHNAYDIQLDKDKTTKKIYLDKISAQQIQNHRNWRLEQKPDQSLGHRKFVGCPLKS